MKTICLLFLPLVAFAEGPKNVQTSGGRFQLIQLSQFGSTRYLLDTQTGRLWNLVCVKSGKEKGECDIEAWMVEDVEGITTDRKSIQKRVVESKSESDWEEIPKKEK